MEYLPRRPAAPVPGADESLGQAVVHRAFLPHLECSDLDAVHNRGRRRRAVERDQGDVRAGHLDVSECAQQLGYPRLIGDGHRLEHDATVRRREVGVPLRPPLGLCHHRCTQASPVVGDCHHAHRLDARIRSGGLDRKRAHHRAVGVDHHGHVAFQVGVAPKPDLRQPVGGGRRPAVERLRLLVQERQSGVQLIGTGWSQGIAGRQCHRPDDTASHRRPR